MTRERLVKLLIKHGIHMGDEYIDALMKRIRRKEIEIKEVPEMNGELAIVTRVAVVKVMFTWPGSNFVSSLIELKRRTANHEETLGLNDGIGHKIPTNKKPAQVARRVIYKKLRMRGLKPMFTGRVESENNVDARFGFLPVIKVRYHFVTKMPLKKFDPDGYERDRVSSSGVIKHSSFGWIPDPLLSPMPL